MVSRTLVYGDMFKMNIYTLIYIKLFLQNIH